MIITTTTTALSSARLEHYGPDGLPSAYYPPSLFLFHPVLTLLRLPAPPPPYSEGVEHLLEVNPFELEFSYAFNPFDLVFGSVVKAREMERARFFSLTYRVNDRLPDSTVVRRTIRFRERDGYVHYYIIIPDDDEEPPKTEGQSSFLFLVLLVLI